MALITCRACGKTISDTADRCVHCGTSIAPEPAPKPVEEKPHLASFNALPQKTKDRLNEEFKEKCIPNDPWLKRYSSFATEIVLCTIPWYIVLFGIFLGRKLAYRIFDYLSYPVYIPILETIHSVSKNCTEWLFYGMTALLIPCYIYHRFSFSELIYRKKLQKWLREEKQMDYVVTFKNAKAKKRFDSIDLDNI